MFGDWAFDEWLSFFWIWLYAFCFSDVSKVANIASTKLAFVSVKFHPILQGLLQECFQPLIMLFRISTKYQNIINYNDKAF